VMEPVLASSVISNVITDVYQLRGQRTAYPILAGEQVSAQRLAGALQAKGGELGIPAGYQATSLTLEQQRLVAGAPREGDHVEVWGTFTTTSQRNTTRVVIQDAEVLSAPSSSNGNTITLAVTPIEASYLIYSQEQGHVWLTLLPPNQKGVPVPPVSAVTVR
jgi:Flp pilus assembly protein CpaB